MPKNASLHKVFQDGHIVVIALFVSFNLVSCKSKFGQDCAHQNLPLVSTSSTHSLVNIITICIFCESDLYIERFSEPINEISPQDHLACSVTCLPLNDARHAQLVARNLRRTHNNVLSVGP